MQVSRSLFRSRNILQLAGVAACVSLYASSANAAQLITTATADCEVREVSPEFTRGFAASATANELTLNNNPIGATNRNVDVIRFHIPAGITSSADLENYAEMRIFLRSNGTNTGQPGSIRVYGVNPTHPLNSSWDETNLIYRDAGSHQLVSPVNGVSQALTTPSVLTQVTNPASVAAGVPVEPIHGTAGYGANSADPRRTPGIRYEAAPYSAQVEAENVARYNYNVALRATFDSNGTGGTGTYLPYIAQPGYNVSATATLAATNALTMGDGNPATPDGYTNIYSDVPVSNRPFYSGTSTSWVDDVESATLLGFSILRVATSGNYEGQYMSFGNIGGLTAGALAAHPTLASDEAAANAALVNFIGTWLDLGYRDLTFLVGSGINPANGGLTNEVQNNLALNFASKEYTPLNTALGGAGALAPQLVLAPEPGSVTLIGLCAAGLLGGRRRR